MRAKRVCSDEITYKQNAEKLVSKFMARGYKSAELRNTIEEVAQLRKQELRKKKIKDNRDRITYISTYDSHAKEIRKMIGRSWHILQSDAKYGRLFHVPPFIVKVRQ